MAFTLSRRNLLRAGLAGGLLGALSRIPIARADQRTPQFLLCIQLQSGLDNTYLFDGRGPKLTEKNLKQNYLLANDADSSSLQPELFTPDQIAARTITTERTGSKALRTPFVDELWNKHKDCLSIVNGVVMLPDNDGHDGNEAYLWGNSDRGDVPIFPPLVGAHLGETPLESMILRETSQFGSSSNLAGSAELRGSEIDNLGRTLRDGPAIEEGSPLWQHVLGRAGVIAGGDGLFGRGAKNLESGLARSKRTGDALASAGDGNSDPDAGENLVESVKKTLRLFAANLTRVGMLVSFREDIDLHTAQESQQSLVSTYTGLGQELLQILDLLKTTMFIDERGKQTPFIELTTFMVSSEFGRTNKNVGGFAPDVGATGADHNPLSNAVLLGGRGIVPGLVVGEGDLTDCNDAGEFIGVSAAHRAKDPGLVKIMGRPFDFAKQRVRTDLPERYDEKDYICMPSVTNTLLDVFGVPEDKRFKLGSSPAKLLTVLRKRGT